MTMMKAKPQQERTDVEVARGVPFVKRVPPSADEVQQIAAGIRQRQGMVQTLRGIGARPPEPHELAREMIYQAGLPAASLPIFQKLFERIEALEDEVREIKRRGLPAGTETR